VTLVVTSTFSFSSESEDVVIEVEMVFRGSTVRFSSLTNSHVSVEVKLIEIVELELIHSLTCTRCASERPRDSRSMWRDARVELERYSARKNLS
jgi:hypothetical protein